MKNFESIYDLILDREKSILKIEKEAINALKKSNEIK